MDATTGTASGRTALAEQLGRLQAELRRRGKTQKAAVEEANRRRRKEQGRAQDAPWPRKEGGLDLPVQTVNDWFPKQRGTKEPSVPDDFEDLWSVIAVMLEWTGQLTDKPSERRYRYQWKDLHNDAQRGTSLDEQVRAYLQAARKAAEEHPHPGIPGRTAPPSLAEVYVRQHSSPTARSRYGASHRHDHDAAASGTGPTSAAEPAEATSRKTDRVVVLIAGPGAGKSTLLRTRLRNLADEWLDPTKDSVKIPLAVPVWVSAHTLAGEETPVPEALAAATRKLSRYGRHPGLDHARFLERPCTGAHWQLLVDDLDELPNSAQRRAVLEKLANAVTDDPPLYRCLVATRPLTDNELDVLDHVLGQPARRYHLQPFTTDDLHTYAEKYFATRWPSQEATRRAQQLTGALRSASLTELARTPLMAFMLCQLYSANPERPLPGGRTALYEAFTDLIYEHNQSKHVADSHDSAIRHLVQSLQSPQARQKATKAVRRVHKRLRELIDYLAHEWLTGQHSPAAAIVASHKALRRPDEVRPELWQAFLEDLMRHTGLLVHRGDGLGFPHQTFLEYHAARYATRNEQACTQVLCQVFPPGEEPKVPALEPPYLGFLLDNLLASRDGIAAETISRMEALTSQGGERACRFLLDQLDLRTNLPAEPTARQLMGFVQDEALDISVRVQAARGLTKVDGYRYRATQVLAQFADDATLKGNDRVYAAWVLAEVDGYRDAGVNRLIGFTHNTTLDSSDRVLAAWNLSRMAGYRDRAAQLLADFADDTTNGYYGYTRQMAARFLARVEGYRDAGADRLIAIAHDINVKSDVRLQAVLDLAETDGYRDRAIQSLAQGSFGDGDRQAAFALAVFQGTEPAETDWITARAYVLYLQLINDPALGDFGRRAEVEASEKARHRAELMLMNSVSSRSGPNDDDYLVMAARSLADVEGFEDRGVQFLADLADDTTQAGRLRVDAAANLAEVEGHCDAGAERLIALANDAALSGYCRWDAIETLARLEGYEDQAAHHLAPVADGTSTLKSNDRVEAARTLAKVKGYRDAGANQLIAIADDATIISTLFNIPHRVQAAWYLTRVEGYGDAGANRLIAIADDTTLSISDRIWAASYLTSVEGYEDAGANRLFAVADDTNRNISDRIQAAQHLADNHGYRDAGANRLIAIADDTTLSISDRLEAARILAGGIGLGVRGYRDAGAIRLIAIADDTCLNISARKEAAEHLARVDGYREPGANRLIAIAEAIRSDSDRR
ncbi:NACHT domain-containing protein [Streptomyces sp. NPDC092370]|uniref:NACHT domain-containing protein n=1 Tax=Streptomyces sp. NPDC092370 TaxID=3366016 RepID=UPI003807F8CA